MRVQLYSRISVSVVNGYRVFLLNCIGALSQSLISGGGQQIITDLQNAQKHSTHCITSAGNLNCNHLIHMATPGKPGNVANTLLKVLSAAENMKANSIALPAFGTG